MTAVKELGTTKYVHLLTELHPKQSKLFLVILFPERPENKVWTLNVSGLERAK